MHGAHKGEFHFRLKFSSSHLSLIRTLRGIQPLLNAPALPITSAKISASLCVLPVVDNSSSTSINTLQLESSGTSLGNLSRKSLITSSRSLNWSSASLIASSADFSFLKQFLIHGGLRLLKNVWFFIYGVVYVLWLMYCSDMCSWDWISMAAVNSYWLESHKLISLITSAAQWT